MKVSCFLSLLERPLPDLIVRVRFDFDAFSLFLSIDEPSQVEDAFEVPN